MSKIFIYIHNLVTWVRYVCCIEIYFIVRVYCNVATCRIDDDNSVFSVNW